MTGASAKTLKDPTVIESFFKIMIDEDFSEILFLPPRYARTVSKLVNENFVLQDANGLKWTVTLSKYKGHLAFRKGWNAFSVGHGLKFGDLLVFSHPSDGTEEEPILKHTHFLVKVYGRSACEKRSFPEQKESRKKRKRNKEASSEKSNYFTEIDSENVNGLDSNTSDASLPNVEIDQSTPMITDHTSNPDNGSKLMVVSQPNYDDESFYIINRDVGVKQGEIRDSLYDLASIEMSPCDFSGSGKKVSENDRITNLESEVSAVGEIPVAQEVQNCLPISEISPCDFYGSGKKVSKNDRITNLESEASAVGEIPVAQEVQNCLPISELSPCDFSGSGKKVSENDRITNLESEASTVGEIPVAQEVHNCLPISEMSPCDFSGSGIEVPENDRIANLESEVSAVGETPVAQEVENCLPISVVPNVEIRQNSGDVGQIDKLTPFQENDSENKTPLGQKQDSNASLGKGKVTVYQGQDTAVKPRSQNAEKNFAVSFEPLDFSDLPISFKPGADSSGKGLKEVKREQLEMMEEEACVPGELPGKSFNVVEQVERKEERFVPEGTPGESSYPSVEPGNDFPLMVKAEPVETLDFISNVVVRCQIPLSEMPDKQPFLELPDKLVPTAPRTRQSSGYAVVYLRGPITGVSMWPVLYLEKSRRMLLTSGWDAFRKANGFSAGDECVFSREDESEYIFRAAKVPK